MLMPASCGSWSGQVAACAPQALIGIVTNPVNTLVPIAAGVLAQAGVYQPQKLFGITTLDVIRANRYVADLKVLRPDQMEVPVVGGHSGVTILPLLSQVPGISFSDEEVTLLTRRIRNAGTEVVEAKAGAGSATLAMGYAAARFTLSLVWALQGQQGIIECAYVESETDFSRFFAQPLQGMRPANGFCNLSPPSATRGQGDGCSLQSNAIFSLAWLCILYAADCVLFYFLCRRCRQGIAWFAARWL